MTNTSILRIVCLSATAVGMMVASAAAQYVYAPPVAPVGVYGYVAYPYGYYNPRRAVRQAVRFGYVPAPAVYVPVPAVVVRGPSDFLGYPYYRSPYYGYPYYGYPYYGSARPPVGYGSGVGSGSAYRSGNAQTTPGAYGAASPSAAQLPLPPAPETSSQPAPSVVPAPPPAQETIPTPPSELAH